MLSIYSKSFACMARNKSVFLAGVLGYFLIALALSGKSVGYVANTVLTVTLVALTLRFFLEGTPMSQRYDSGILLRTFGALLLTAVPPLALVIIASAIVSLQGAQVGPGALALLALAVLAMPVWVALTGMALPAAALKRPILAHAFGEIRKTFLPTLGGLVIGPFAVLLLQIAVMGGLVASLVLTGNIATLASGGPKILAFMLISIALQLLAQTLAMAVYAHVWRTRVALVTQAEVFA